MTRIFSSLALVAFSLLVLNLALGMTGGDYNGAAMKLLEAQRQVQEAGASGAAPGAAPAAKAELRTLAAQLNPVVTRAHLHLGVGVVAALVNVLVNSISVTYFIGTTRWCREVVETYHLDEEYTRRSNSLKRSTFPWALGAILTILGIVALGGAADPTSRLAAAAAWVTPHYVAALAGVALIGWSYLTQSRNIAANYRVIEQIVADVQRIRQEHGLAVE